MAAPINNNGGRKSDKLWRDALILAVKRTADETIIAAEDPKAPMIVKMAAKCVGAAVGGDLQAMKEIGDRIDGKPHQSMDIATTHERSVRDWTEAELDAAIASVRGKAAKGNGSKEPDRVHLVHL